MMNILKKVGIFFAVLIFWLGVWELIALAVGQELLFPTPFSVVKSAGKLFLTSLFWKTIFMSVFRIILGTVIAILFGIILAILTSKFRILNTVFYPLLVMIKTTPVASFITIALIWIGAKRLPIFICFLMVLPLIWAAISDGIKAIDKKHLELAYVFKFSLAKKIKFIYIPTIAPYFLSACQTSIGLAWKSGVAAEVLAVSPLSIGKHLFNARIYYEIPELFAWTIVVILLSLLLEVIVTKLLNYFGKRLAYVRDYAEHK